MVINILKPSLKDENRLELILNPIGSKIKIFEDFRLLDKENLLD